MKKLWLRLSILFLFVLMLSFPANTVSGASAGLLLWFQTILPTLLPCMILSDYLIRIGADTYLTRLFYLPFSRLFGVSPSGTYAILIGFLCGYPVGAKTIVSLLEEKKISHPEASYLLTFCNQPSPMFLIGYLYLTLLLPGMQQTAAPSSSRYLMLAVLVGIYGSALCISVLYRLSHPGILTDSTAHTHFIYAKAPEKRPQKATDFSPLTLLETSMMGSFEVLVKIGGYMMLFSILETFVFQLTVFPDIFTYCLMSFIEMTTGCRHLSGHLTYPLSAVLCGAFTAFGGLSGLAQTANVIHGSCLSAKQYVLWKLLQGILAGILICGVHLLLLNLSGFLCFLS